MKIYNNNQINEMAKILNDDGILSVPTDTVYGICARLSPIAKNKLIQIKNRPQEKNLPIMCANKEQIKSLAIINDTANILIDNFMPGPLTLILNKKKDLPSYINNGIDTIAIRMASSNVLEQLILAINSPLFMSSCNISGKKPCQTIEEIQNTMPNLDGILDGEVCFGQSSTIVDCTNQIKILRQGPITYSQIIEKINKKS